MKMWGKYKSYIENLILDKTPDNEKLLPYWRTKLFALIVTYLLPFGLIASAIGIIMALQGKVYLVAIGDGLAWIILLIMVFAKNLSVKFKKILLLVTSYIMAFILLVFLGGNGPGMAWILGLSVITTLVVSSKAGYATILINLVLFVLLEILTYTGVIHSLYFNVFSVGGWAAIFSNLLLVNSVLVASVSMLINSMDKNSISLLKTQQKLAENEQKLQIIFQAIGDAIIVTDIDHRIMKMNTVAEKLTGWDEITALGLPLKQVLTLSDTLAEAPWDTPYDPIDRLDIEGTHPDCHKNILMMSKNTSAYFVSSYVTPIKDFTNRHVGFMAVLQDNTVEHHRDEAIRHAHKMEAVSMLAGGIAHDFNNMLAGILGFAELIQIRSQNNPELHRFSFKIIETAQRAAELTSQLLTFSKKQTGIMEIININSCINETAALLNRLIGPDIHLIINKSEQEPLILGEITQIQNMLLYLGMNAKEAIINQSGIIIITVDMLDLDSDSISKTRFRIASGKYVGIHVSDNGIGMDYKTCQRIFDPFFTTKDIGKGSGLGLSSVYGTVVFHNGAITVESAKGTGTVFHIYLPQYEETEHQNGPSPLKS